MSRRTPPDTSQPAPCPCGSGATYPGCCGRWHAGPQHLQAPSAEALMRSRYSAYVLGLAGYLHDTWHPDTRPDSPPELQPGVQWLGLEVKRHRALGPDSAEVAFVARSKFGGRAHRLVETSRFVREAGRWFYRDAVVEPGASAAG